MQKNMYGERAFVAAILLQALSDATSQHSRNDAKGAVKFLQEENFLFDHYCGLLGIEPEYARDKIRAALTKKKLGIHKHIKRS